MENTTFFFFFFSGTRKHKHIQKLTVSAGCKETHCTNNKISAEFACQAHLPDVNNARSAHIKPQKKKKWLEKEYMRMEVSVGLVGEACQVSLLSIASKKRKK